MDAKDGQLTWEKVKTEKIDFDKGHKMVISKEMLLNSNDDNTTAFIVLKKWKVDDDGVAFKKPTKIYLQESFWNQIVSAVEKVRN